MIVDDDIEIRKIVSIYLKNEGYEIIDASDAIEALETLRNTTIDLIILDCKCQHKHVHFRLFKHVQI